MQSVGRDCRGEAHGTRNGSGLRARQRRRSDLRNLGYDRLEVVSGMGLLQFGGDRLLSNRVDAGAAQRTRPGGIVAGGTITARLRFEGAEIQDGGAAVLDEARFG